MGYIHLEIDYEQTSKKPDTPCGDIVLYERTPSATTVILCDGLGSGIKANISATMCGSRIMELIRRGFSLRDAFSSIVKTMHDAKEKNLPYAAFALLRILNDGEATILTYEIPPPIFIGAKHGTILHQRNVVISQEITGETNCYVEPGDAVLMVSDGLPMAGLGLSLKRGWTIEGIKNYVNDLLSRGEPLDEIHKSVDRRGRELWQNVGGDDCTALLSLCRYGDVLNILTGPPSNRSLDQSVVKKFMFSEGKKIVCGASTAAMVAKYLGKEVLMDDDARSVMAPPKYEIEGIDLVTEGAVTLNQVYNIIEENPDQFEPDTGVTELCDLLMASDRINFFIGKALNPGYKDIAFRQKGLMPRARVVSMLGEKLEKAGKLVVSEYF